MATRKTLLAGNAPLLLDSLHRRKFIRCDWIGFHLMGISSATHSAVGGGGGGGFVFLQLPMPGHFPASWGSWKKLTIPTFYQAPISWVRKDVWILIYAPTTKPRDVHRHLPHIALFKWFWILRVLKI